MVIDGSQWLEHRDLGARHQQQFQEPIKIFLLDNIFVLRIKKKLHLLYSKDLFWCLLH